MQKRSPNSSLQDRILLYLETKRITSISAFASGINVKRPSVSRALSTLAKHGLVNKSLDGWTLSPRGKKEVEELRKGLPERVYSKGELIDRVAAQKTRLALAEQIAPANVDVLAQESNTLFALLASGLVEWAEKDYGYPYPSTFQLALNRLAVLMANRAQPIPSSLSTMIELFEQPLRAWWPAQIVSLPLEIDPNLPLLYDGLPDEQLIEFIAEHKFPKSASPQTLQAIIDQQLIEELVRSGREDPHLRGPEYVIARRFLIEHPWTDYTGIQRGTQSILFLDRSLIHKMYEPVEEFDHLARYDNQYWVCPSCNGILSWIDGLPRCAKPSICAKLFPDYVGRQPIEPAKDLFRLRWSIHARACLPGKTEIELYDWLRAKAERHSAVTEVEIWPGVDLYDLRVKFKRANQVWAVDVKDYHSPLALGRKLKGKSLYDYGDLRWDRGFYVVPDFRVKLYASYLDVAREAMSPLPANIEVLSASQFRRRVDQAIRSNS